MKSVNVEEECRMMGKMNSLCDKFSCDSNDDTFLLLAYRTRTVRQWTSGASGSTKIAASRTSFSANRT